MQSYYVDQNMNTNKFQISSDFICLIDGLFSHNFLKQPFVCCGTSVWLLGLPSYGKSMILAGNPSWLNTFLQHFPRVS